MYWRYLYGSKTLHAIHTGRSLRSICGRRVVAPEHWLGSADIPPAMRVCGTCTQHTDSRPCVPSYRRGDWDRPATPATELVVQSDVNRHELQERVNRVFSRLRLVVRYPCGNREDCTAHLDCLAHQIESALLGVVKERSVA